ncbi:uncharacterized protein I303_104225 [Kwoniella dejecticola CBS 10117]|uniref:CsbD-like domain-containing protein n=1 Tax=Kwoniella dejecticola CBS 10117 TaxID=1296121 RepID=A0A1A6A5X7_9TREE|nr:uncharacterized protein I303_04798 [Kwoniella dejecticola CBS 10117]OBR85462.1 hypothetical protein I303_04798 [Kwoniella dejecticola CBS 10117]
MVSQDERREPSQVTGQLYSAAGAAQQAVASMIPSSLGGDAILQSGQELSKSGQAEVDEAKGKKAVEATIDSGVGKAKSALGYLTSDQEQQSQGNKESEKAQWDYKQATSDSIAAIPVPSKEVLQGKIESVQGMVMGDQHKQMEGNKKAEKAAWTDGV